MEPFSLNFVELRQREVRRIMEDIYKVHSVGKPYIKKNYKKALQSLYERGAIGVDPKPKKGTFADHISVTFPSVSA